MKTNIPIFILATFAALLTTTAHAAKPISINFNNGAPANKITETIGVVPDRTWIEFDCSPEGQIASFDGTLPLGSSGTELSWNINDIIPSRSPIKGVSTGHPDRLFRAQLRTQGFDPDAISLTFSKVPEELVQSGYDVIVYWQDSTYETAPDKIQRFTIGSESRVLVTKAGKANYGAFVEGDATSETKALESVESTNTAVFKNLKSASFTLKTSRNSQDGVQGSATNGGIAALQIVPTTSTSTESDTYALASHKIMLE